MTEWIPCGDDFIEADVIRWQEAVWERRGPKGARPIKIGERIVTAEVQHEDREGGWVFLLVRGCEVISQKPKRIVELLKPGESIRRKRSTLARNRPQRLRWSDESARAVLIAEKGGSDRRPSPPEDRL